MKIALVHGGTSTEKDVSTKNAGYIEAALRRLGHQTVPLLYDRTICARLAADPPDAVFLCVQGKGHGDGTLQAVLDLLDIPYTGSRMEAAAIINDKIVCQKLFALDGIPTPPSFLWTQAEQEAPDAAARFLRAMDDASFGFPCVAKAPTQGGSFGIACLESPGDIPAVADPLFYDDPVLVEQFIGGTFYTVGLLERPDGLLAFPVVEGVSLQKDCRLTTFDGQYAVRPAELPADAAQLMQEYARRAFRAVNARGYARADFILQQDTHIPYILEINAVPGLKPQSLYPPAAQLAGVGYDEMIGTILQNAVGRK